MGNTFTLILYAAIFVGPFVGYLVALRWPHSRRWHLVANAALGSGLPAAFWAALATRNGLSFSDTAPYALLALAYGAFIGLCGIAARSLGGWLSDRFD